VSLTWSVENIKDYETVCWIGEKGSEERRINPVTETLVFMTIGVGLGSITDENVGEFAARFRIMEKVQGPFLVKGGGKDWYLSDEDFIAHIGLYTNVSNETRPQWASRVFVKKQTSVTEEMARHFQHDYNRKKVSA
jgi:hypothetical protein